MLPRSLVPAVSISLAVVGFLLVALGILYLAVTTAHLPSFIPGHISVPTHALKNGRVIRTHTDTKRGIATLLVAVAVLGGAWFVKFKYEPVD